MEEPTRVTADSKAPPARSTAPGGQRLRIAAGIATSGRPAILAETLADLERQTVKPDQIFVLYSKEEDIGHLAQNGAPGVCFLQVSGGLCEKRNRILEDAGPDASRNRCGADLIFFLDDDFLCHPDYLRVTEEAFRRDPGIVAATGMVLADGAVGPGLTMDEAKSVLRGVRGPEPWDASQDAAFNTYGCNMTFRLQTVLERDVRFDEDLPAYGWYEDIDFSRRLARFGSMVRLRGALGVHLGAKVGRVSGRRLGYSQVANPLYLARKGSYPWSNALRSIARNFFANLVRSFAPERYVDRRGRLRGNLLAFADAARRRVHPSRIHRMV